MGSRFTDTGSNRLFQDYNDRTSYQVGDEIMRLDVGGSSERIILHPINDFVTPGAIANAQWSLDGQRWFDCPYYDPALKTYSSGSFALGANKPFIFPDLGNYFRVIAGTAGSYAAPAVPNMLAGLTKDDGLVFGGGSAAGSGSAANSPSQVTTADAGGTTSATANTFTTLRPANAARQFLTVTNTSAAGTLYLYLAASGGTPARSIPLAPGQTTVLDAKVPTNGLQIAGSAASMTYACFEG